MIHWELNGLDRHTFVIPLCDLYSLCHTIFSDWVCHSRDSNKDSACMDFEIILIDLIFADLHKMKLWWFLPTTCARFM